MNTLRMILVAIVALSIGCNQAEDISGGVDVKQATEVTFAQLKEVTKGETKFSWVGSDDNFHYFETKDRYYRLTTRFKMPHFKRFMIRKQEPGLMGVDAHINGETISPWTTRQQTGQQVNK